MNEVYLPIAFTLVGALIARTERIAASYHEVLAAAANIFSENYKLWWSTNLPAITCRPTSICACVCYMALLARSPRWIKSVKKLLRVYNYFMLVTPEEAADRIYRDYTRLPARGKRPRPPFIRVCGTGDLFPQLVLAINVLVRKHPEIPVWVATRKPAMVALLDRDAPNLFIVFSLDSSQESWERMAQVFSLGHLRLRFSYLRTSPKDRIPACVSVVYNQQTNHRLPTDDHPGLCPADAGRLPMAGACAKCRRCWSLQPEEREDLCHRRSQYAKRS